MTRIQRKSTGPRTAAGKNRSSRNSRRHGLFEKALQLTNEQLVEFKRLRSDFYADLKPETPVEKFVVDDLVACAWKLTRSLGHEQISIHTLCSGSMNPDASAESPQSPAMSSRRSRLNFIEWLRSRINDGAIISQSPELKQQIRDALGEDMGQMLSEWDSGSLAAAALAHAMVAKCETFKMDLPQVYRGIDMERDPLTPGLYQQLIGKLLDQEARNILRAVEGSETPNYEVQRADLFMRYDVTNRRSFYQILRAFHELRNSTKSRRPTKSD